MAQAIFEFRVHVAHQLGAVFFDFEVVLMQRVAGIFDDFFEARLCTFKVAVGVGDLVAQALVEAGEALHELAFALAELFAVVVESFFRGFLELFQVVGKFFLGTL